MNQYTIQSKLGQGAFSVVYKVTRKQDATDYAMKKMRIMGFSQKQLANCLNQVRILASIEDPHIVGYKDSFFDQLTKTFCVVTEYLDGGDLAHYVGKYKSAKKSIQEKFIWKVAYQTLKGLQTLHKQKILHRDIKSANIFLTKDLKSIKLGDMNVSIVSSNGMAKTQTGTPYYASPQVWNQKTYSTKCDIWSLGCVLYELATFKPPFLSPDMKSLKRHILSGVYKRIPSNYSDCLQQFIRMCLKVDPIIRPSAEQLLKNSQFISVRNETIQHKTQFKLLQRINVPRKKDFRIIKDKLPKNRFSVDKVFTNCSYVSQKDKQNIQTLNSTTIINTSKLLTQESSKNIKNNLLPSLHQQVQGQRATSASRPETELQKQRQGKRLNRNNQVQVLEPQERPPLPKNRSIRG